MADELESSLADKDKEIERLREVLNSNPKEVPHWYSGAAFGKRWDKFVDEYIEWQKAKHAILKETAPHPTKPT